MSVLGCGTARVDRVAPVLLVALSCAGLMACQGITVTTAPGASGAVTTSAVAAAPGTAAPGTATKGSATKGSATNGSAAKGSAAKGSVPPGAGAPATAVLAGLAVKGRAPMTGYQRTLFGGGWADEDHDGCSTREEILRRDLTAIVDGRSGRCRVVAAGELTDPYSGHRIGFRRGATSSEAVQIDHVVAVGDAWQTGAQQWSAQRRIAFYNDPLELLAVEGDLNQSKGDGDAATWLPPSKAYRCSYVARQVAVKARWGLWVTPAEKAAVARILAGCPDQRVPTG